MNYLQYFSVSCKAQKKIKNINLDFEQSWQTMISI